MKPCLLPRLQLIQVYPFHICEVLQCTNVTAIQKCDYTIKETVLDGCDFGWCFFNETHACYRAFETLQYWETANDLCKEEGGHLTSVHNQSENDFIFVIVIL